MHVVNVTLNCFFTSGKRSANFSTSISNIKEESKKEKLSRLCFIVKQNAMIHSLLGNVTYNI